MRVASPLSKRRLSSNTVHTMTLNHTWMSYKCLIKIYNGIRHAYLWCHLLCILKTLNGDGMGHHPIVVPIVVYNMLSRWCGDGLRQWVRTPWANTREW